MYREPNLLVNNIKCPDCGTSILVGVIPTENTKKLEHYTAQGLILEQIENSKLQSKDFQFGVSADCQKCQSIVDFDDNSDDNPDENPALLRRTIFDLETENRGLRAKCEKAELRVLTLEKLLAEFSFSSNWEENTFKGIPTRPRVTALQLVSEVLQ